MDFLISRKWKRCYIISCCVSGADWQTYIRMWIQNNRRKSRASFFLRSCFYPSVLVRIFFFTRVRRRSVQVHISLGWCMNGGGCLLMPREDLTIVWMEDKWMNSPWWWSLVSSVKCAWNWVITDFCRLLPLLCCGRGDRWLQLHSVFHNALCLGWEHWRLEKFVCFQWSK